MENTKLWNPWELGNAAVGEMSSAHSLKCRIHQNVVCSKKWNLARNIVRWTEFLFFPKNKISAKIRQYYFLIEFFNFFICRRIFDIFRKLSPIFTILTIVHMSRIFVFRFASWPTYFAKFRDILGYGGMSVPKSGYNDEKYVSCYIFTSFFYMNC